MGGKQQNLVGRTFSRLIVVGPSFPDRHGKTHWNCKCSCGVEGFRVNHSLLVRGKTTSCGCFQKEQAGHANRTHGKSKTVEYRTWQAMLRRCYNKNCIDYKNYGKRGIRVCPRWRHSFENFFKDMGKRPKGMTLDRKRVNGNYSASNCQWATREQQNNNTRASRRFVYKGKKQTMSQWAKEVGISTATIYRRLALGWSVSKAISTPNTKK